MLMLRSCSGRAYSNGISNCSSHNTIAAVDPGAIPAAKRAASCAALPGRSDAIDIQTRVLCNAVSFEPVHIGVAKYLAISSQKITRLLLPVADIISVCIPEQVCISLFQASQENTFLSERQRIEPGKYQFIIR
jgi:hypothetical protein